MLRKIYRETSFGERLQNPPALPVIDLARDLKDGTDEPPGVRPARVERVKDDPEARRIWKSFQMVTALPERDQNALIRPIYSLVAVGSSRTSGEQGERHAR